MNLAWKEIKFYKFRFILIMFIIFLMAIMVLFISGLAQGLAKIYQYLIKLKVINLLFKNERTTIRKSILSRSKQDNISKIIDENLLKWQVKLSKSMETKENVMAINSVKNHQPNLKSGHYPKMEIR